MHERRRLLACGLALLLCAAPFFASCASSSARKAEPLAQPLAQQLDQLLRDEALKQQWVGVSMAIARTDGVVHVAHFGMQDRERGIPADDGSLYRWASISKPLTAVLAMQLANEGALDLDRDVRDYVPEFPPQPYVISSRQLLCHQGGIVHYVNGPVIALPARTDVAHPFADAVDALRRFAGSPLIAEPGTRYSYTTHGYVLLGAVLQRAGKQDFDQAVAQRIAQPAGMSTLAPDRPWVELPGRCAGYRKNAQGEIVPSAEVDVSWKLAGGGFISNVHDLGAFASALLACSLLDRENRELMWSSQATRNGEHTHYGLGFRIDSHRGERLIQHSGAQEKTRTRLLILPERGLAVALMCNSEWADLAPLGSQLLDALISAPPLP